MNIEIKHNASPDGEIRVNAGELTFYFSKATSKAEILAEVKRTTKKEMGLI